LSYKAYTVVNLTRPLLRRALITRLPVGLSILARNPEVRFFLRTLPRRVRFVITVTYLVSKDVIFLQASKYNTCLTLTPKK
jgi:hypothetical protein